MKFLIQSTDFYCQFLPLNLNASFLIINLMDYDWFVRETLFNEFP